MTNIKITQQAREAAASIAEWQASTGWRPCFFVSEFAGKAREGIWDNHPLVEMMQALINQTVERCAQEADKVEDRAEEDWKEFSDFQDCGRSLGAYQVGEAIRALKDN